MDPTPIPPVPVGKPPVDDFDRTPPRTEARRAVATLVITVAVALSGGLALKMPTQLTANDISRYCTVWSLLERGTYAIDECPWQKETQDKVRKPDPFGRIDPKTGTVPEHFYSSKPPLLATLIAGVIYPFRAVIGVPLDTVIQQPRVERNVQKDDPEHPGTPIFVKETPPPVEWPVYILYLKPVTILLNIVPFLAFLILYARMLDRYAANDWAWMASLIAASFGTLLFVFNSTLNNHTLAAYSAFFAIYALAGILDAPDGRERAGRFVAAGFFGAFTACQETPAAIFGLILAGLVFVRSPRLGLVAFIPAALIPLIAFFGTQYLAFGQFKLVYEEFGTKSYTYEGSYWNTPLEFDWFNKYPESTWVYLFHMTLGHHGVFSLTPVFVFSVWACVVNSFGRGRPLRAISAMTLVLTVALIAFYAWNPKARNYGGTTNGLRWLFWLIPFWLVVLPTGLAGGQKRGLVRALTVVALLFSGLTVGYALRNPWSSPWTNDLLEHLNLYPLVR